MNKFTAAVASIPEIEAFIEEKLTACKVKGKTLLSTKLVVEEILSSVINGSYAESDIAVHVRKTAWKTDVIIKFKGPRYEVKASDTGLDLTGNDDDEAQNIISGLILKSYSRKITPAYRNGINTITISADVSSQKNVIFCLYAIVLACAAGFLLRLLAPQPVLNAVCDYILTPLSTIIMNSLKMLMAPIIFFSIASSMGTFKDIREFGRVGIKVFSFYVFTTIVAVLVCLGMFTLLDPFETGSLVHLNNTPITEVAEVSLISTIVNIVPSNIFASFHNADTLQIIFLSIILGICAGKTGKYSEALMKGLNAMNELFLKVADFVVKFLPVVVFTSISSMIITTDVDVAISLGTALLLLFIASVIMTLFYLTVSSIKTRKSPAEIIRKTGPAWLNAYSLSSSSASIPYSMDVCKNRLKISPKIYSFSIPLGATINMDGTTILLAVSGLFLIKGFGGTMSAGDYVSFFFIIVVLSMGCPGLPGASIMAMTILCQQFNIPASGVALVTPLFILFDPLGTADNIIGDICGTMCVAKSENLIDE